MSNGITKIESMELPLPEFPRKPGRMRGDCITAPQTSEVTYAHYVDRFDQEWRDYVNEVHRVANAEIARLKNELAVVRTDSTATIMSSLEALKVSNNFGRKAVNDFLEAKKALKETQDSLREIDARISGVIAALTPTVNFVRVDKEKEEAGVEGGGS